MPDPSLILDRRAEMGTLPGLHALLIGVSDYEYLKSDDDPPDSGLAALQKLDFAALSAFRLKEKLAALDAAGRLLRRLKTVRLLVAPSAVELGNAPTMAADKAPPPTWDNIQTALWAWREDVARSREEMAFFYFGGHGIRRALEESILLAGDFLRPMAPDLAKAFRLSTVRGGMVPSAAYPNMGRDQFYFVDACRDKPAALDQLDDTATPKIWDVPLNSYDYRRAPLFLSTPSGGVAAGESGKTTYFVEALLWGLDHASYRRETLPGVSGRVWPVRAVSLKDGLECFKSSFDGKIELTGLISDPILCFSLDPPTLTLRIDIAPDPVHAKIERATLAPLGADLAAAVTIAGAGTSNPCEIVDLTAGLYKLSLVPRDEAFGPYESDYEQIHVGFKMPWLVQVTS